SQLTSAEAKPAETKIMEQRKSSFFTSQVSANAAACASLPLIALQERREPGVGKRRAFTRRSYLICPETSLVISNILTCPLPLKTGRSASSALIWVRFFLS